MRGRNRLVLGPATLSIPASTVGGRSARNFAAERRAPLAAAMGPGMGAARTTGARIAPVDPPPAGIAVASHVTPGSRATRGLNRSSACAGAQRGRAPDPAQDAAIARLRYRTSHRDAEAR